MGPLPESAAMASGVGMHRCANPRGAPVSMPRNTAKFGCLVATPTTPRPTIAVTMATSYMDSHGGSATMATGRENPLSVNQSNTTDMDTGVDTDASIKLKLPRPIINS